MNVLPRLVPTNFTFQSGQHKMFPSSKITGNSSWSIDLHPHLEVSRKAFISLFSFCVLQENGFGERTAPLDEPIKSPIWYLCQADDAEGCLLILKTAIWIVRNAFRVVTSQSKWLYNQVSLSFSFPQENTRKAE